MKIPHITLNTSAITWSVLTDDYIMSDGMTMSEILDKLIHGPEIRTRNSTNIMLKCIYVGKSSNSLFLYKVVY